MIVSENDKEITCIDCGDKFTFTEAEQRFYLEKQYSEPKRCKSCRAIKKQKRAAMERQDNEDYA